MEQNFKCKNGSVLWLIAPYIFQYVLLSQEVSLKSEYSSSKCFLINIIGVADYLQTYMLIAFYDPMNEWWRRKDIGKLYTNKEYLKCFSVIRKNSFY